MTDLKAYRLQLILADNQNFSVNSSITVIVNMISHVYKKMYVLSELDLSNNKMDKDDL